MDKKTQDVQKIPHQISTFYIEDGIFGIDVQNVQEITRQMPITPMPLTPSYISGLINLRGEIATAIYPKDLFKIKNTKNTQFMNVICSIQNNLLAFLVDEVGDVINIDPHYFESTPDNIAPEKSKFLNGVYKEVDHIISIIDINQIYKSL